MPLIIVAVGVFLYMKRRKEAGGNQLPPTPHTPHVSEYYNGQPTSPMLSPGSATYFNPYVGLRSCLVPLHACLTLTAPPSFL